MKRWPRRKPKERALIGISLAVHSNGGAAEPLLQQGRINPAEVRVELEVAIAQVGQTGMGAVNAWLHAAADEKRRETTKVTHP